MADSFRAASTAAEVLDGQDLRGKRILVTGVSAGIGIETARILAAHGAHVIGTARDLDKARIASSTVLEAATAGGGHFEIVALDLASLASVRACAQELLEDGRPIDVIIANAGVMATPFGTTQDGFETQFGTNHLGHFALINRLVPLLSTGSRVIVLASLGHRFADVDIDDPNFDSTPYNEFIAYGRSKTANILFAVELDRRLRDKGIRAAAVHPGRIATELSRHISREKLAELGFSGDQEPDYLASFKSIPQGAATSVWAAVVARADEIGGRYCEDCHVAKTDSDPQAKSGVAPYAVDPERAISLWALSEFMVGTKF